MDINVFYSTFTNVFLKFYIERFIHLCFLDHPVRADAAVSGQCLNRSRCARLRHSRRQQMMAVSIH